MLILQRRLTEYRVPLFWRMRDRLSGEGIRLDVVHGTPTREEEMRRDEGALPWATRIACRYWYLGGYRLAYQNIPGSLLLPQNLIVLPHEASQLVNYKLLAQRRLRGGTSYAFWGHGPNLALSERDWLSETIKRKMSTQVDWWFAYTSLSVQRIVREGFPEERITCLNNAVDVGKLIEWRNGISEAEQLVLRKALTLDGTHVGVFLGSLSEEKRLDFLFRAADLIRRLVPTFELLIVGDGPMRRQLQDQVAARPWCKWVGAQHGREKVLHLSLGHVFLNPGMIGLGILDAFALRLPLVTTNYEGHSPEIAYLRPGHNGLMVLNDVETFANEVTSLFLDTPRRRQIAETAGRDLERYSLDRMADKFCDGIVRALAVPAFQKSTYSSTVGPVSPAWQADTRVGAARKVIATTSSYEIGLTGLLTEQALSISEQCAPGQFLFVSGEREQFSGLFAKLREHSVRNERIPGFDEHHRLPELVRAFDRYVKDFRPDVVHVNTNWQLLIAVLAKHFHRHQFAVIYTIHGYRHNYPVRAIWAKFLIGRMLYLFADRVIAPSAFLRRQFSFLGSKIDTLFIGVDKSFLGPYVPLPMSGPKRIVFAGAFREGKNQDVLIRVLKRYIEATGDSEVELYLPGDGAQRKACMMLSERLGLEKSVFFPGFVDREKMLEYYKMCQFAAVPSNVETFGQCISEPFALGRIVMTRRVGVAEDVIVHGKTGYLFDTEEDLLQVFLTVLPDSAAWGKVSRAAHDCRHLFDWGPICARYLKMVDEL